VASRGDYGHIGIGIISDTLIDIGPNALVEMKELDEVLCHLGKRCDQAMELEDTASSSAGNVMGPAGMRPAWPAEKSHMVYPQACAGSKDCAM